MVAPFVTCSELDRGAQAPRAYQLMLLQPGVTLGPYSVAAKIGEAGMGEASRARDTKRADVALNSPTRTDRLSGILTTRRVPCETPSSTSVGGSCRD